ncbi:MAG: Wzz/FepE/Etk N-terminal domain-containing protein, partial [Cyclonatronaceae bacterium]
MKNPDQPQSINLLDILITIAREKWFIFITVFIVTAIALVISLIWPVTYKSSSTVMPLKEQQSLGGLGALAGSMLPLSFDGEVLGAERLAVILSSRSIREATIEQFDLMKVYEKTYIEEALNTLDSNTEVNLVREGGFGFSPINAIEISVTDKEPDRAQAIASFYVSYLDSVANDINETNSRERFEIIRQRFEENQKDLEIAEEELKAFQEEYGIIDIETQSQV